MHRVRKQTGPGKHTEITDITREDRVMKRVFLSPAVIVLLGLSIFPLFWSLGISFTDILRGGSTTAREAAMTESAPVGFLGMDFSITLRNYDRLLDDQRLHTAARNTMYYVFVGVTVQFIFGMLLALALHQNFIGRKVVRVIFLMPMMTMPVVVAYAGRMMFDSSRSPIADLWRRVIPLWEDMPLIGSTLDPVIPWLTNASWARATIVLMDSWQWIPFVTLILLAGMQAIPEDIYEAARVDGASAFQQFRHLTLPMLLVTVGPLLIASFAFNFNNFTIVELFNKGGPPISPDQPAGHSDILITYTYELAFGSGRGADYGFASTISLVIFLMVALITFFNFRFTQSWEEISENV